MQIHKMWIDGQFVDAVSVETIPVINPATEEEMAQIPRPKLSRDEVTAKRARRSLN